MNIFARAIRKTKRLFWSGRKAGAPVHQSEVQMPASLVFAPLPRDVTDAQLLRLRCDSQSMNYYSDISHFVSRRIKGFHTLSVLDVGSRTGAGLALLRLIHHPSAFTRLKFDPVAGIDLDPAFEATAALDFPDVSGMTGDIANLPEKSWDVVICSHTIEHIEDAENFVRLLERLARKYVVLACPFEEADRVPGHVRSIGPKFFNDLGYLDVEVYESHHWHNGYCCLAFKTL